jgi:hypothetical protein
LIDVEANQGRGFGAAFRPQWVQGKALAKPPEAGEFSAFLTLNFECPEKEIYMKII